MALVSLVAAAFYWNEILGVLSYLACLILWLSTLRNRAAQPALTDWRYRQSLGMIDRFGLTAGASMLIAMAAGIAFCGTCSIAQIPFITVGGPDDGGDARSVFRAGLLLSMSLGTLVALYIYWGTWPVSPKR